MKRPIALIMGVVLLVVRVLAGVYYVVVASLNPAAFIDNLIIESDAGIEGSERATVSLTLTVLLALYAVALLVILALAIFVYLGHNWARLIAMLGSSISIALAFVDYWNNGAEITLRTTLPTLASDILILLALSSRSARQFAKREPKRERHVKASS
ncbi:hypothetical protein GCM10027416_03080 [Okibacterium endophyticum]